jgi:hypothetical protein
MAHLVSDAAAQGCNDSIIRNPQMEAADADALAAQTLGTGPVKAFLQQVLYSHKARTGRPNNDSKCCNISGHYWSQISEA